MAEKQGKWSEREIRDLVEGMIITHYDTQKGVLINIDSKPLICELCENRMWHRQEVYQFTCIFCKSSVSISMEEDGSHTIETERESAISRVAREFSRTLNFRTGKEETKKRGSD